MIVKSPILAIPCNVYFAEKEAFKSHMKVNCHGTLTRDKKTMFILLGVKAKVVLFISEISTTI